MRTPGPWCMLAAAVLLLAACGDGTGPPLTVTVSGPERITLLQDHYEDGTPRISCDVDLVAQGSGGSGQANWTGAAFDWRQAFTTTVIQRDSLNADETLQFWGSPVRGGGPFTRAWIFYGPWPFAIDIRFHYAVGGRTEVAAWTLECQPPAPLPTGTYRLVTVNGHVLPWPVVQWDNIHAASLTFYPNMTYTYASRVEAWGQTHDQASTVPEFYGMPAADSLEMPSIAMGVAGGRLWRQGNKLAFFQANCCGRPDYAWLYLQLAPPSNIAVDRGRPGLAAAEGP